MANKPAGPWEKFGPITVDPEQTAAGPWQKFSGGGNTQEPPPNYTMPGAQKPSPMQDFFGTTLEDIGGLVPSMARTAGELIHHPIDTTKNLITGFANMPETLADEYKERPGQAIAHATELALPAITKGLGKLVEAPAPALAESSLGIRGTAKAFGATPGKAILEETSGVRPSTVEESARTRLSELNNELEGRARNATSPVSLKPARDVLAKQSTKAAAANSEATPRELTPMQEQLVTPREGFTGRVEYPAGSHTPISFQQQPTGIVGPGGAPITRPALVRGAAPVPQVAEEQPAIDFLGMKRQFDKDFIRNWNPAANTKGALGTARKTYGAMANEFNAAVPGAPELNQRISSLVPVAERARLTDLSAGPGERIINRVTRPTGAMLPAVFGLHEGGIPGLFGALAGQETFASPTAKMLAARTLYGAGKGLEGIGQASRPLVILPPATRQQP